MPHPNPQIRASQARARRNRNLRRNRRVGLGLRRSARMGGLRQPVQYFKRATYKINAITATSGGPSFVDFTFQLADVPNHTEFTALYDQYCIKGVKMEFIPRFNVANLGDTIPELFSIVDYDGSAPSTEPGFLQYQNLKMTRGTQIHKRYLKPAVLPQVFQGVTTGYSIKKNQWIDSADDALPHYGVSTWLPTSGANNPSWDLKVTYYLAFKNVR